MNERVLRSNPDKANLLLSLPNNQRENQASVRTAPEPNQHREMDTCDPTFTPETATIIQLLQKMQMDTDAGLQALKEDFHEQFTTRLGQMSAKVESLMLRMEQAESNRTQETNIIQEQPTVTTVLTSRSASTGDEITLEASEPTLATHRQAYNMLRIAIDKQIDEIKPYFGKKMENVESWIKKIDKLAEIAEIPDEEVFTLAKLKLQGDAEKWWDNKKKEISSWTVLKSKLIDTFGPISKSSKLELEAFLHRRQQTLHESATKYWNDMMSHCTTYDENMPTQDRVWRIVNGALPEFRCKYENKVFDDEDHLLRALIQHEENRLRGAYEGQDQGAQISMVAREFPRAQDTWIRGRQQSCDSVNQQASFQQRPPSDSWSTSAQQPNRRPYNNNNNNGRWNTSHPN